MTVTNCYISITYYILQKNIKSFRTIISFYILIAYCYKLYLACISTISGLIFTN